MSQTITIQETQRVIYLRASIADRAESLNQRVLNMDLTERERASLRSRSFAQLNNQQMGAALADFWYDVTAITARFGVEIDATDQIIALLQELEGVNALPENHLNARPLSQRVNRLVERLGDLPLGGEARQALADWRATINPAYFDQTQDADIAPDALADLLCTVIYPSLENEQDQAALKKIEQELFSLLAELKGEEAAEQLLNEHMQSTNELQNQLDHAERSDERIDRIIAVMQRELQRLVEAHQRIDSAYVARFNALRSRLSVLNQQRLETVEREDGLVEQLYREGNQLVDQTGDEGDRFAKMGEELDKIQQELNDLVDRGNTLLNFI